MKVKGMSKAVSKIQGELNDKEAQQKKMRAEYEAQREQARQELLQANTELETADSPADYARAKEQIRQAKCNIDFYNKQIDRMNRAQLSLDEYKETTQAILSEYKAINAEHSAEIKARLYDLMDYIRECDSLAAEYNAIIKTADRLACQEQRDIIHNGREIVAINRHDDLVVCFMNFYATQEQKRAMFERFNVPR